MLQGGYSMKEKSVKIPKDFWEKERPQVTLEEALKDVTPIEWKHKKNENIVVYSVKEKNSKHK